MGGVGQQWCGGGGNSAGVGIAWVGSTVEVLQPLRTALHTINISLRNSLSCETELKGSKST